MPRGTPRAIKVVYSDALVCDVLLGVSPSGRKPGDVAAALAGSGWPVELVTPRPMSAQDLSRTHDPIFVEEVLSLRRPNGFGSFSESVARAVPHAVGACHDSALLALDEGIAASLTSGFHHAGPRTSRGFCTFNGLMVTAMRLLEQRRVQRVAIIDCDYHYGDGTQALIDAHALAERVLHVSFGELYRRPEQASAYLEAVDGLRPRLAEFAPDLVIYQAGADTHVDDPLGGLLTTQQMRDRDRSMFVLTRELEIPICWNLAGGYQVEPDGSIPRVVALHLNTFEEALRAWDLI